MVGVAMVGGLTPIHVGGFLSISAIIVIIVVFILIRGEYWALLNH